jgi:hypothetical protein
MKKEQSRATRTEPRREAANSYPQKQASPRTMSMGTATDVVLCVVSEMNFPGSHRTRSLRLMETARTNG